MTFSLLIFFNFIITIFWEIEQDFFEEIIFDGNLLRARLLNTERKKWSFLPHLPAPHQFSKILNF